MKHRQHMLFENQKTRFAGLWQPPPPGGYAPRRAIVEKYVEIECVGGSEGLKNVIVCLQDYMGGQIGSPCNTAQGIPISYLGQSF